MNLYKRWVLHIDATDKIISDQYRIPIVIIYPLLFFANNSFNALSKHLRLKRSSLINVKFRIPKIKTKAWKKAICFTLKIFNLFCCCSVCNIVHNGTIETFINQKFGKYCRFFYTFNSFPAVEMRNLLL